MTPIEQQRLIGAILLLLMISVATYFLISGANTGVVEKETVKGEQDFTSVVQPLSEDNVEVVDYADETLLDPHNLGQQENNVEVAHESKPVVEQQK